MDNFAIALDNLQAKIYGRLTLPRVTFPEVTLAEFIKPVDWKKYEVKGWAYDASKKSPSPYMLDFKTATFSDWDTEPSSPIDDIKAIIRRPPPPRPKPSAPADAVPIADGVSLRPLRFEIEKVVVLKAGEIVSDFWGGPLRQGEIRVHFKVPSRDTGEPLSLYYRKSFDDALAARDPEYLPGMIRQTMRAAYMHEVDEMLYFEGEQFTEPHPEESWMSFNDRGRRNANQDRIDNEQAFARVASKVKQLSESKP